MKCLGAWRIARRRTKTGGKNISLDVTGYADGFRVRSPLREVHESLHWRKDEERNVSSEFNAPGVRRETSLPIERGQALLTKYCRMPGQKGGPASVMPSR